MKDTEKPVAATPGGIIAEGFTFFDPTHPLKTDDCKLQWPM